MIIINNTESAENTLYFSMLGIEPEITVISGCDGLRPLRHSLSSAVKV